MTHMQFTFLMCWQAVAPAAFAALCAVLYFWWINRPNDDDGDAPGLLVEVIERIPFGFHMPKGKTA